MVHSTSSKWNTRGARAKQQQPVFRYWCKVLAGWAGKVDLASVQWARKGSSLPLTILGLFSCASTPARDPVATPGLSQAYQADPFPEKVNLGVGAYRDDGGNPYVLKCIRAAEAKISGDMDME